MAYAEEQQKVFLVTANPQRSYWVLLVLAVGLCAWRLRYLYEPLENDITIRMAYGAHALNGAKYYSDLSIVGPPGTIWVNELFVWLCGANEISVYAMGCIFAVLGLLGVYRCACLLTDTGGGLVAATAWALLSGDLLTQANQPNSEVVINAALIWGFALVMDQNGRAELFRLIGAGLLFFLASSMKHFIAVIPVFSTCAAIFLPHRESTTWRFRVNRDAIRVWAIIVGSASIAWFILFAWFWSSERAPMLFTALFGNSWRYAAQSGGVLTNLLFGSSPAGLFPEHQRAFIGLYAALALGLARGLLDSGDRRFGLLLAWTAGAWLSVSFSGRFYPHYYMLWMPVLAIGAGVAWAHVRGRPHSTLDRALKAGITLILVVLACRQAFYVITIDANSAVLTKYPAEGPGFAEVRILGAMLATPSFKDMTVFEIGAHGLYFYAKRQAPLPFVDSLYGKSIGFEREYREAMLPLLITSPPTLLVVRRTILERKAFPDLAGFLFKLLQQVPYSERTDLGGPVFAVLEHKPVSSR